MIEESMRQSGIVPVVVLDDPEDAVPLAEVLVEKGIDVIEITCRTPAAFEAIENIASSTVNITVGAGTVLSIADVVDVQQAGAQFAVAPGCNLDVVAAAFELDLLFIPGVMTPSEIETAHGIGCSTLKFFPAGAAGGPSTLKALQGPYSHLGLEFIPTGGVSADNLAEYLALDCVAAVGGSWIVKRELIAERNWQEISRRIDEARTILHHCRPAK